MGGYFPTTVYGPAGLRRSLAESVLLYRGFRALGVSRAVIAHRMGIELKALDYVLWRARRKGLLGGATR